MLYKGIIRKAIKMHKTSLRKVGGSIMLAVPPPILELLALKPGETVGVTVEGGRLVVEPHPGPQYTLEELLAASDYSGARSGEDEEWLGSGAVGREIL
jgi:antitoxin ChpS